jgi:hypothetical protein
MPDYSLSEERELWRLASLHAEADAVDRRLESEPEGPRRARLLRDQEKLATVLAAEGAEGEARLREAVGRMPADNPLRVLLEDRLGEAETEANLVPNN